MNAEFATIARAKREALRAAQLDRAAQYVTAREVAALLPLSYRHVADRITHRKGFPAPAKFGAKRFWKVADIRAWLDSRVEK